MANIIIKTAITFFAIYGLTQFIKDIIYILLKGKTKSNYVIVVKVLNAEESLEATIRTIVWKTLAITRENHMPEILIVDMGSTDSTAEIAKKLCSDYGFIAYTTKELYLKVKNKTEE